MEYLRDYERDDTHVRDVECGECGATFFSQIGKNFHWLRNHETTIEHSTADSRTAQRG